MTTMEILGTDINDLQTFGEKLRDAYLETRPLLENRDPGQTTMSSLKIQENIKWDQLPYNSGSIANGSAMRSGCIGIFYPGKFQ